MEDTSSREQRMKERVDNLLCSYCPPNRGENAGRWVRHGAQKRKSKNKRR